MTDGLMFRSRLTEKDLREKIIDLEKEISIVECGQKRLGHPNMLHNLRCRLRDLRDLLYNKQSGEY